MLTSPSDLLGGGYPQILRPLTAPLLLQAHGGQNAPYRVRLYAEIIYCIRPWNGIDCRVVFKEWFLKFFPIAAARRTGTGEVLGLPRADRSPRNRRSILA